MGVLKIQIRGSESHDHINLSLSTPLVFLLFSDCKIGFELVSRFSRIIIKHGHGFSRILVGILPIRLNFFRRSLVAVMI